MTEAILKHAPVSNFHLASTTENKNNTKPFAGEINQVRNMPTQMKSVKQCVHALCKSGAASSGSRISGQRRTLTSVSNVENTTKEEATQTRDSSSLQSDESVTINQFYQSLNALASSEGFHQDRVKEAKDDFSETNTSKADLQFLELLKHATCDTAKECVESFLVMRKMVKDQIAPGDKNTETWLKEKTSEFVKAVNTTGLGSDSPAAGSSLKGNKKLLEFRAICNQMSSRLPTDDMSYNQKIGNLIKSVIAAVPDSPFLDRLMQDVGITIFRDAEKQHDAMMHTLESTGGKFTAVHENLLHQTLILELLRNGVEALVDAVRPPNNKANEPASATPGYDPAKSPEAAKPNSPIIYNDYSTHYHDNSVSITWDEGGNVSASTRRGDQTRIQTVPMGKDDDEGFVESDSDIKTPDASSTERSTQMESVQNHSVQTTTDDLDAGYVSDSGEKTYRSDLYVDLHASELETPQQYQSTFQRIVQNEQDHVTEESGRYTEIENMVSQAASQPPPQSVFASGDEVDGENIAATHTQNMEGGSSHVASVQEEAGTSHIIPTVNDNVGRNEDSPEMILNQQPQTSTSPGDDSQQHLQSLVGRKTSTYIDLQKKSQMDNGNKGFIGSAGSSQATGRFSHKLTGSQNRDYLFQVEPFQYKKVSQTELVRLEELNKMNYGAPRGTLSLPEEQLSVEKKGEQQNNIPVKKPVAPYSYLKNASSGRYIGSVGSAQALDPFSRRK